MGSPPSCILRSKKAVKLLGKFIADPIQIVRDNSQCYSTSKIHQSFDQSARRRFGRAARQSGPCFSFRRRRKGMEHRQVRGQLIALRRVVGAAKLI